MAQAPEGRIAVRVVSNDNGRLVLDLPDLGDSAIDVVGGAAINATVGEYLVIRRGRDGAPMGR